ncbi:MAG: hypothetical protein GX811_11035, partial [Lentisphaerae bacterium]|nr:hypothetical protein [Lentisphaerota bacterium]
MVRGKAFNAFVAESFAGISRDDCVMAQVAYLSIALIATPCPSTNFPQNFRAENKCVELVPLIPPVNKPNGTINLGIVYFIKMTASRFKGFAKQAVRTACQLLHLPLLDVTAPWINRV